MDLPFLTPELPGIGGVIKAGVDVMRLNFSHAPEEQIEEGIARLGRVLERCLTTSAEKSIAAGVM